MKIEAVIGASKVSIAPGTALWQHGEADFAGWRNRPRPDIQEWLKFRHIAVIGDWLLTRRSAGIDSITER